MKAAGGQHSYLKGRGPSVLAWCWLAHGEHGEHGRCEAKWEPHVEPLKAGALRLVLPHVADTHGGGGGPGGGGWPGVACMGGARWRQEAQLLAGVW